MLNFFKITKIILLSILSYISSFPIIIYLSIVALVMHGSQDDT